ncbi:hypothetical protein ED733_006736 [Metarhizium rileyi]|uniref:Uncharacterized protein n=1 Tax=Metarhizium rileyi (strain RCEF 4871) TaxID=1649241 RepID=A0A5C6GI13_METRR|nr:hypothetical protein ED733_006736 [Metarhizium rileyi]
MDFYPNSISLGENPFIGFCKSMHPPIGPTASVITPKDMNMPITLGEESLPHFQQAYPAGASGFLYNPEMTRRENHLAADKMEHVLCTADAAWEALDAIVIQVKSLRKGTAKYWT